MNDQHEKDYLSKEKYTELERELEYLTSQRRKEVAEQLEHAKSLGDLSENTEYQQAREDQAALEERITNLDMLLKDAEVVSGKKKSSVGIGSTVTIQKKGAKNTKEFKIVGSEESDSSTGKVSNKSPMGDALFGAKTGEEVAVNTPNGTATYKIVSIN